MKCRVDTHTALGYGDYANQTKIGFFTWGSNIDNSREVMSILGNGNVGIGMISPEDKLHTDVIRIGDWTGGGNGFKFSMDTNAALNLSYMTGQTVHKDIMTIQYNDGNVGIGTTSPTQKLHVEGDIHCKSGTSYVQISGGGSIWRNYGPNSGGAGLHFTTNALIPADLNGGNHGNNTIDLGSSSYKWRNLYVYDQVQSGSVYTTAYMSTTGYTQSGSYYIAGASTQMYNAGGLWGMRYNTNAYSWHRWNGPHHFDLYSNSSFTSASVPFYINYYSGAQTRCYNFQNYSDDRIKTNERYITNATQTLLKLKPQIYDKGPNLGSTCSGTRVESGLIAQDVYYDTPELRHLVGYHDDAEIPDEKPYVDNDPQKDPDYSMWGSKSAAVDYIGLIAYLIKSNQEIYEDLQTTRTDLQTTKEELQAEKAKVAKLELLIEGITTRMTEHERQTGFRM
jgi:hypothetical protein